MGRRWEELCCVIQGTKQKKKAEEKKAKEKERKSLLHFLHRAQRAKGHKAQQTKPKPHKAHHSTTTTPCPPPPRRRSSSRSSSSGTVGEFPSFSRPLPSLPPPSVLQKGHVEEKEGKWSLWPCVPSHRAPHAPRAPPLTRFAAAESERLRS